jgi:uroporphyrinogen III methyltransferase/synthase
LITRTRDQSRSFADRLRRLGAAAVVVPTIRIIGPGAGGPLDHALEEIHRYHWIVVTSANGARACLDRARALNIDLAAIPAVRWAAVGPVTAAVLRGAGITVALVPRQYLTDTLARDLDGIDGKRVLLPRTDAAGPTLASALRARGAIVDEIAAYRTVLAPAGSRARIQRVMTGGQVDTVTFTSASTVHGLVRLLEDREALRRMTLACIGPVTAAAVVEEGYRPAVVAHEHTVEGLVRALVAHQKGDPHARDRAAR